MDSKSIIVSGGIGTTGPIIMGGLSILFPDMIVPEIWGVVLVCVGCVVGIATVIYYFWPINKDASQIVPGPHVGPVVPGITFTGNKFLNVETIVHFGDRITTEFVLTDFLKGQALAAINRSQPVGLAWKKGRSKDFVRQLEAFLKENGVTTVDVLEFADALPSDRPMNDKLDFFPDGLWAGFESGGAKQVIAVDVSL